VGNVRSEHAAIGRQRSIGLETAGVFDNFVGAHRVTADLVLSIRVIQDDNTKSHFLIPECLPSPLRQCAGICAVEH